MSDLEIIYEITVLISDNSKFAQALANSNYYATLKKEIWQTNKTLEEKAHLGSPCTLDYFV
jgi:hypothetical protein